MARKTNKSGGAAIEQVGALHELTVKAATFALSQALETGEVSPALLTSCLRICTESGVSATELEQEELFKLNDMLSNLKLDTTISKRSYAY